MNCFEWTKKVTGFASIHYSIYSQIGEGEEMVTVEGDGFFNHGELYNSWTRRELQCQRSPLPPNEHQSWLLRNTDLCQGRASIDGVLYPLDTLTVTTTIGQNEPTAEQYELLWWFYDNGVWIPNPTAAGSMFPIGVAYPNWENDPYSVARRNQIDLALAGDQNYICADIIPAGSLPPLPQDYPPNAPGFKWLMGDDTAEFENSEIKKTAQVSYGFELI